MKTHPAFTLLVAWLMFTAGVTGAAQLDSIEAAIQNSHRAAANVERDGARKPAQVLDFIGLHPGDVVLDYGAGGGYWTELFSTAVGAEGKVYAQQRAGERFESQKAMLTEQFAPFGNVELMPLATGMALPLDSDSVDTVMLSYLFHHMHYADGSGDAFPDSTRALFGEFRRVLKPGGTLIVIEHVAADGASRAQSASWHRTPPATAQADITSTGFDFAGEAPDIFYNPEDDLMNNWNQTGMRGKTTSFVHKYRKPD